MNTFYLRNRSSFLSSFALTVTLLASGVFTTYAQDGNKQNPPTSLPGNSTMWASSAPISGDDLREQKKAGGSLVVTRNPEMNYTTFSQATWNNSEDVKLYNKGNEQHPELGVNFPGTPCDNCYELIDKRTETQKYYVKEGSEARNFILLSSPYPMHYKDAEGRWVTVKNTLQQDATNANNYFTKGRLTDVAINTTGKYSELKTRDGYNLKYNNDLELVFVHPDGTEQSLGKAKWNKYTAGDNGMYVKDAWPGIDIEMSVLANALKTGFIVNAAMPAYAAGKLVIRDRMQPGNGMYVSMPKEKEYYGEIEIKNKNNTTVLTIGNAFAYEKNAAAPAQIELNYKMHAGNVVDIEIPGALMNKGVSAYPLVIDPLASGIVSSGFTYTPALVGAFCNNVNNTAIPGGATITDIKVTFSYSGLVGLTYAQSAISVAINGGLCPTGWANCGAVACTGIPGGTCGYVPGSSFYAGFSPCIPPFNCNPYTLPFELRGAQTAAATAACAQTQFATASGFYVVVEGSTVVLPTITPSGATTLCMPSTLTLTGSPASGVWSSSAPGVATVAGGVVTGGSNGFTNIILTASGCTATVPVTVGTTPTVTGAFSICFPGSSALTGAPGGGIWTSSLPGVATVTAGGLVNAVSVGTTIINYNTGTCSRSVPFDVNAPAAVAPPTQPTGITFPGTTTSGGTINFTPNGSTGYLVVASTSPTLLASPVLYTTYATGSAFGGGIVIQGSTSGSTPSYTTSLLNSNTQYYVFVFAFNNNCVGPQYCTAAPLTGSFNTCIVAPTGLVTSAPGTNAITLSWTGSAVGGGYTTPINYNVYAYLDAAMTMLVPGYPVMAGTGTTFTVGGLMTGTQYWFRVAPADACNAMSNVATAATVCTAAGSVPYLQTFEIGTLIGDDNPNCMTSVVQNCVVTGVATSTTFIGVINTNHTPGGTKFYGTLRAGACSAGWTNQWLYLPRLNLQTGTTYTLSVWYRTDGTSWPSLTFQYSTVGTLPLATSTVMGGAPGTIGPGVAGTATTAWTQYLQTFTVPTSGTYWIGIDMQSAAGVGGQMALDDIEVCAVPTVTATNSAPPYCAPASVFLSSTGTSSAMTYAWSGPSGYSSTLASPTAIPGLVPGTYTYSLTAVNDPISLGFGGYCTATGTTSFTVTAPPLPIVGTGTICVGQSLTLTCATPGGTWSSSTPLVGTVNATGDVTGTGAGTTTISYTVGGCYSTTVVTVLAFPAPITGALGVCLGSTTTLNSSPAGGTWLSSNTATGTINTSGVVSALALGTTTITYSLSSSCYVTAMVTVNPNPTPIAGQFAICVGTTVTLTSTPSPGFWTISPPVPTIATVHPVTGVVTGNGVGTANIVYTAAGCSVSQVVTVVPNPAPISGPATICIGFPTTTYTNVSSGGTWTTSNGNASIGSSSGIATGATAGPVVISYALSPTCYSILSVNVLPAAPAPTGTMSVCVGATTTLSHATPSGTWSATCPGIASVTTGGGVVSGGPGNGTCIITYTLPTGCIATATVAVHPNPAGIGGGSLTVCQGATTTLSNTTPLGSWSSSNTAIGTIGSASGIAGGISATPPPGTTTISYTLPTGCYSTATLTVSPIPVLGISSPTVCVGATTTVTATPGIGAWSSTNTLVATVSGGGVVTGVAPGTSTISFQISSGCAASLIVTVIANPTALTGTLGMCTGTCTTLNSTPTGGAWSTSAPGTAPVSGSGTAAGLAYGIICGSASGTANISYTVAGCYATAQVTVNSLPGTPTGPTTVCVNSTVTLTATPGSGTWSGPVAVGTVNVNPATGEVTGISTGTALITYSLGTGCTSTRVISVNPLPSAITATSLAVCVGNSSTLSSSPAPGTWASINVAVGSINTTGLFTGTGAPSGSDTVTLTYTLSTGCQRAFVMTVNELPAVISGLSVVCEGACTPLSSSPGTGTWSSSVTAVGTINASGNFCGVAGGTSTVSYILPTGCYRTHNMVVNPLPTGVTPASPQVCEGSCTTITGVPAGGNWLSGTPAIASITPSGSLCGIVSGVASLIYTLPSGCSRTFTATVNPLPSAITGTLGVCVGVTTTLTSTPATGTWSSPSPNVTVNSTTGEVTGVAPGGTTATISYTLPTTCRVTAVATVHALPAVITATPSFGVCVGRTTTLNSTPGGTWSSSAPGTGSVDAGGVVTGVSSTGADVITISNTNSNNCVRDATVTVYALPTTITGAGAACVGACTTLTSTPSGGTWSSSNTAVGSIGSTSGVFCGVSGPLTVNITYTLPSGCIATRNMTVQPLPPIPTAPSLQVCAGQTITLSGAPGATWTTSDPSVATVDAFGVVTGNPGVLVTSTAIITSSYGTGCSASVTVTVQPIPTAITGILQACETYGTTTLTGAPGGGTWSSSTPSVATIGSMTGIVTTGVFGTTTITYRLTSTSCYRTEVMTVNQLPTAFTGPTAVCILETVTLNSTPAGGAWSSTSSNVNVNAGTGEITGVTAGTAIISYANGTTGCVRTGIMTVNALPNTITGIDQVCVGLTTTLNTTSSGGSWSSSQPLIGSINSGGVVTGVAPGTTLISYTFISTGCRITAPVTVNQLPTTIMGSSGYCNFSTATYTSTPLGGTWTSSNTGVADFITLPGEATSSVVGTATITYTLPTGCLATKDVFTIFAPYPITGADNVCLGDTIIIGDTIAGGSWSVTSATSSILLTPNTPYTTIATGMNPGTADVTYTLSTGCYSTRQLTVNPIPNPITGVPQVCVGLTTDLDNTTTGGVWSSSNTSIATVGTGDGLVTGIDGGVSGNTVTITYALGTGCNATQTVTVDPLPDVITGIFEVCEGLTTTLTSAPTTGTWTSNDPAVATAGPGTGIITGVNAYATGAGGMGQTIITYTLPTGCIRTQNLTVNPLPAAITGIMNLCENDVTVLSNSTPGGSWISSNPTIASINSFGIVTGHNAGSVVMSYVLSTGCISTWPMTINANPDTITGSLQVCAGFATNLYSGPSGGVWSQTPSSMPFGTINPITGVVSGITAGLIPISYTLGSGCHAFATVTVVNLPAAIGGDARVCEAGGTTLLTHVTSGGTWSSSNPARATVDPISGQVTGITAGTSTITYMIGTGCFNIRHVTVNPLPAIITGPYIVCEQSQITLANATPGGTWSSGATTIATIGSSTGILTGEAAGQAPISYILTATGCARVAFITVNPTPAPITGNGHICTGSAVTYSTASTGGTWINGNPSVISFVGSVMASSITVLPVSLGTASITYQYSGSLCQVTRQLTVQPLPIAFNVTGGGSYCAGGSGVPVGLDSSQPGVSYELRRGSIAAGYINGTGFPFSFGLQAVAGTYTVQATNVTSGCQRNMAGSATVIINTPATPTVTINVSPTDSVCPGETVTLTATPASGGTAPTYVWKVNGVTVGTGTSYSFVPAHGDIASVVMTSNGTCLATATATISRPITVLPVGLPVAGVTATPNDSLCQHTPVTLTAAPMYGGNLPVYKWYVNGIYKTNTAAYTFIPNNGDVAELEMVSNYRCKLDDTVMSPPVPLYVEPMLIPHVAIHANPGLSVAIGKPVTLSAVTWDAGTAPAYQWKLNGHPVPGATDSIYTAVFNDNDSISCEVISSGICHNIGTSEWVFITVTVSTPLYAGVNNNINLHPNPNKGQFTIRGTLAGSRNEDADMEITNMLGQVVYKGTLQVKQGKVDAQIVMDKTLANGMYILSLHTQDGQQTFHFVMEQ